MRAALALGVWQIWGASSVCLWGRGLFCLVRKQYAYLTRAGHAMYMYAYKRHPYPQFLGLTYGIQVILSLPPPLIRLCMSLVNTLSTRWKISYLFYFLLKRGRHVYKNVQNGVGVKSSYKVGDRPVMPSLNLPLGTIQYLIYVFI